MVILPVGECLRVFPNCVRYRLNGREMTIFYRSISCDSTNAPALVWTLTLPSGAVLTVQTTMLPE